MAERLAASLEARLVPLGQKGFVSYRLARPDLVLDLWDRAGAPLEEDLARRDLTINAMALEVAGGGLVDPLGGLEDLRQGRLRVPSAAVFDDDPLRVLRLVRLSAELPGFHATPETVEAARDRASRLPSVAAERVRHELEIAFAVTPGTPWCELLCQLDLYPAFLPGEAGLEAEACLQVFARCDALLEANAQPHPTTVSALPLRWRLLLGALPWERLECVVRRLARRGYLGRRAARECTAIARRSEIPDSAAERRWFLHTLGPLWPTAAVAAASLAVDRPLSRCRRTLAELTRLATTARTALFDPAPLLATEEVMELCGLPPGPALGRVLSRLRRAQVEGRLTSPDDARRWLAGSRPRS